MSRVRAVAAALVGGAAIVAGIALFAGGDGDPDGIEVASEKTVSDRLVQFTLSTPALADDTNVRVLLPSGYQDSNRRYPVLYLLHGAAQDERAWIEQGAVDRLTQNLPLIVVMPDGGPSGYYSDWYNGGDGGPPMWETYHVEQLIPWVDSEFRTNADRSGRAIAGISMGGFGALSYAARHRDLFSVAASFSGVVDSNYKPYTPFFEEAARTPEGEPAIWGPRETDEERWRAHNPWDLAPKLRGVEILLFTGDGEPGGRFGGGPDPVEMAIHDMNVSLHERLLELGIPHQWHEGPGVHSFLYAQRYLADALPDLMQRLRG